jgi:membrane-associated protein
MMQKLIQIIIEYGYVGMTAVIFAETGLLVGFFLPGDSLLFTAGMMCAEGNSNLGNQHFDLLTLNICLVLAAIIGDTVGYWIGKRLGAPLYEREQTWFFRRDHLLATKDFYDRHGGKTIVLARFVPFMRTFAPVVAGITQMPYLRFVFFNVFGGLGWVTGLTLLGYKLGTVSMVKDHLEISLILIVFVSLLPAVITFMTSRKRGSPPSSPAVETTGAGAKIAPATEK